MLIRRVFTLTSGPPVSASGISPQNDYVSSFGIGSGHVFGTAVGAPLLCQITPSRSDFGSRTLRRR
jgi:hypothetical protein